MLNKIGLLFWRIAGLKAFMAALLVYMVFGLFIMPQGLARIQQLSGKPVQVLDLQFSYSAKKARQILGDYTPEARSFTAFFSGVYDGIYPLVYTFLFLMLMGWLGKLLADYGIYFKNLHLLPFVVLVADYCENSCIIIMLKTYPHFPNQLAELSSFFTSLKLSSLVIISLIICCQIWLYTFYRISRARVVGK